ncbi:Uncharacterised protein [Klebsiella pneumoniae]|nr:Uncharacterised protein [Klebsiella pneumoniae]SVJ50666.1 Uncharacterised protein [Klebsiella pneumoniae]
MSDFVNFNELVDSIVIEKDYGANRNASHYPNRYLWK